MCMIMWNYIQGCSQIVKWCRRKVHMHGVCHLRALVEFISMLWPWYLIGRAKSLSRLWKPVFSCQSCSLLLLLIMLFCSIGWGAYKWGKNTLYKNLEVKEWRGLVFKGSITSFISSKYLGQRIEISSKSLLMAAMTRLAIGLATILELMVVPDFA